MKGIIEMKKWALTVGVAALAALVSLAASSNNSNQANQTTSEHNDHHVHIGHSQRHNQADVTFAQQMIPHHQQAIQMSDMVLAKKGIDPRVIDLANQIKSAQGPEFQQMQGWLTQWRQPVPPSGRMMPAPA